MGEYWLVNQASRVKLSKADQDLIQRIFDQQEIVYDPDTMSQDTGQLARALLKGFGKTATQYASEDYLAYTMMEINLNRFGFNKNLAEIYELNQAVRAAESFQQFKDMATEIIGNYKVHHLRTEYNLAVATAQNAARYNRQVAEAEIFPYLQYQTAGDDKVREEHAALDGKIFSIHDAELDAIYPPNGFGCRCEMVQVDSQEGQQKGITPASEGKGLLGEEWDNMVKYGFDKNKAVAGEVFDLNKVYAQQLNLAPKRDLADLGFANINLPVSSALKSMLKNGKLPMEDLSQDTLLKRFSKKARISNGKPVMVIEDHAGRPVGLERETLVGQTSGSFLSPQEQRNALFMNVEKVMRNPDEVWLVPGTGDSYKYVYVKFYQDEAMAVTTLVDRDQGRRIVTWEKVKNENSIRKGLLIKRSYGSK